MQSILNKGSRYEWFIPRFLPSPEMCVSHDAFHVLSHFAVRTYAHAQTQT